MRIRFDAHARRRQRERAITDADVELVLRAYDTEVPARYGRRHRFKDVDGRRLRVTFDRVGPEEYYVWTVTSDEIVH